MMKLFPLVLYGMKSVKQMLGSFITPINAKQKSRSVLDGEQSVLTR